MGGGEGERRDVGGGGEREGGWKGEMWGGREGEMEDERMIVKIIAMQPLTGVTA